jgi:ribosome biogenesis GTPase
MQGVIVSAHGKRFGVETLSGAHAGTRFACVIRGKKAGVACNDQVEFSLTGPADGVIETLAPRRNLLYRSDEMRSKLIAANVDQVILVTAAVPAPRPELIDRCLIAAAAAGIPAVLVINKADLPETAAYASELAYYAAMGYPLLTLSARGDLAALNALLHNKTSVLVGTSGVGKSTLLNALVPDANAQTGDISIALDAGRHTTTHANSHTLPGGGRLIDSPGMQAFGLAHLDVDHLSEYFPDFAPLIGSCRFYNCRHLQEPGCAVLAAVAEKRIAKPRWQCYRELFEELKGRVR